MGKKQYNLKLAREVTELVTIPKDDHNELARIFGEDDIDVGTLVYKLRLQRKSKFDIIKIIGINKYELDRLLGTISFSQYLSLQLSEVFKDSDVSLVRAEVDAVAFRNQTLGSVKNKLAQMLAGITPDKIFDSDVPGLVGAIKDLHAIYRLESGQATQRIDQRIGVAHITDPAAIKASQERQRETAKLISDISKQLEELDAKLERGPAKPKRAVKGKTSGSPETIS